MQIPIGSTADDVADLSIIITPGLEDDAVTHLIVEVDLKSPALNEGDVLVKMPLELARIPTTRYDGNTLKAFDQAGRLELSHEDDPLGPPVVHRTWKPKRNTVGRVTIIGTAHTRHVDSGTKNGPGFDCRYDNRGIVSSGHAFLPLPPDGDLDMDLQVRYDLTSVPEGYDGIWSHDEPATRPTTRLRGKPSMLAGSFFMVGPVKKLECASPKHLVDDAQKQSPRFGLYWLKTPPFDVDRVFPETRKTFEYMCSFFKEDKSQFYRIFVRHDPYPIVRAGLASSGSFLISFGTLLDQDDQDRCLIPALFCHEMVHNWLILDQKDTMEKSLQWYGEGLAEYYSLFFRHQQGLLTTEDMQREANFRAQAYYTSPLASFSDQEAGKLTWKTQNAQRLPYGRGFVFFIRLEALIRDATGGKRGLDELVIDMVQLERDQGHHCTLADFLRRLGDDIGHGLAKEEYEAMSSGKIVVPPHRSLVPGLAATRRDMETFDLGFDEESILSGPRVVRGLDPGSRAAQAGVRDGDVILRWTNLNRCKDDYEERMDLKISRALPEADGTGTEELGISFWPRGWNKVEGYWWQPAQ